MQKADSMSFILNIKDELDKTKPKRPLKLS